MKFKQVKLSNVKLKINLLNNLKGKFSKVAKHYHYIFNNYIVASNKRLNLEEKK